MIWALAWPTMLQNVMGGVQGFVGQILIGRSVGYVGNAAIGVSWQIFMVVMVFLSSLFTGMNVVVARYAGAGDHERVEITVHQAVLTAVLLSVVLLAPVGWALAPTLLELVNTTPEVRAAALPYLRILFGFSGGTVLFFMLCGALLSAGDAKSPLRLGVALTALNLALSLILIPGLGPLPALGTTGAALAMVISGWVVAGYGLVRLWGGGWVVGVPPRGARGPDPAIIRSLVGFGLPAGLQGVAMNLSAVTLIAFIGSLAYSAEAQAAHAVAYGQLFALVTWSGVGLMGAASAVVGQCLGAGRPERSRSAVWVAAGIGVGLAAAIGLAFMLAPRALLGLFGIEEPMVLDLGAQLLRVLAVSGLFVAVGMTHTGALQGSGDLKGPLAISIVAQMLVPLGICALLQARGTLDPIDVWLAIAAGHVTRCALSVVRFHRNWRGVPLAVVPERP